MSPENEPAPISATETSAATTYELNPTASVDQPDLNWRERLGRQLAEREARQARDRAIRGALSAQRNHGLRLRHAEKLSRGRGGRR